MYGEGFRFKCTACGGCCSWQGCAPLYPDDVERIAKHLDMSEEAFIKKYSRHILVRYEDEHEVMIVPYLVVKTNGNQCIFLENHRCSIHEVKPWHCAKAPFLAEFMVDDEGWNNLVELSPGFGQGEFHDRKTIESHLAEQDRREYLYEKRLESEGWDLQKIYNVTLDDPIPWDDLFSDEKE